MVGKGGPKRRSSGSPGTGNNEDRTAGPMLMPLAIEISSTAHDRPSGIAGKA